MQIGLKIGVPFEEACGGNAECCTCHVYLPVEEVKRDEEGIIDSNRANVYQEPEDKELDALDFTSGTTENSRLACQMKVTWGLKDKTIIFLDS